APVVSSEDYRAIARGSTSGRAPPRATLSPSLGRCPNETQDPRWLRGAAGPGTSPVRAARPRRRPLRADGAGPALRQRGRADQRPGLDHLLDLRGALRGAGALDRDPGRLA